MNKLLIYGCGGLGLEILSCVKAVHDHNALGDGHAVGEGHEDAGTLVTGFIDDNAKSARIDDARAVWDIDYQLFNGVEHVPEGQGIVIAMGEPQARAEAYERSVTAGLIPYTVVHPTAVVSPTATIGKGSLLGPFTFVGPFAQVGQNCIVNNYASVGHDAVLGDSSVLSPYSTLNGSARCGERSFLGTASVILVGKSLGANSKISAGSVLHADTEDGALAVGNPAKSRVMFRTG